MDIIGDTQRILAVGGNSCLPLCLFITKFLYLPGVQPLGQFLAIPRHAPREGVDHFRCRRRQTQALLRIFL
jgi:hypothetical protein